MNLISPKNAFVEEIFVTDGASVDAGANLLRLEAEAERLRLVRARSLRDVALIMAKRFEPAELAEARTVADASVALAATNLELKSIIKNHVEAILTMGGGVFPANLNAAECDVTQARSLGEQARAQRVLFESALGRAKQQSDQLLVALAREVELIERQIERLTLRAPIRGVVRWQVAGSSFVRQGDVLGELT